MHGPTPPAVDDALALHRHGVLAHQSGSHDLAIDLIGKALAVNAWVPAFHSNLGAALKAKASGQPALLTAAVAAYRRALVLRPDFAMAHNNLGAAFQEQNKPDEAIVPLRRALVTDPDNPVAHNTLGAALRERGRLEEARDCFRGAAIREPGNAYAFSNLGVSCQALGRPKDAALCYRRAIICDPSHEAAHHNFGIVLSEQGELTLARASYRRALIHRPDMAEAHNALGNTLKDQGDLDPSRCCYERAMIAAPDFTEAHSNLLFALNNDPVLSPAELFAAHRRWNESHGRCPMAGAVRRRSPARLRIGYVSPDFRRHSVAYFLEPLLRHHDKTAVEIFCYSDVVRPDAVTARLKLQADHWRSAVGLSDQALIEQIRSDGIDILVDLAGHTARNRLPAFAARPAPVQVTWLGYPHSTGLAAMDYRFVDAVTDPPGEADRWASERLIRLDRSFLCYGPPDDAPGPVAPPSTKTGVITFGSFNSPAKLSGPTLACWAMLLGRVPGSRLFVKGLAFADAGARDLFLRRMSAHGIAASRISLSGQLPAARDHLELYGEIDIALDPFPYNGTTTTCEALWMGVPVVALRGDRHAGRVGASLLTCLGLDDLIGEDVPGYISIAGALAKDTARLTALRTELRPRMIASPLCDAASFARKMEAAYRHIG